MCSSDLSFPSFLQVVRGYLRLLKDIYWGGKEPGGQRPYAKGSQTSIRRGGE